MNKNGLALSVIEGFTLVEILIAAGIALIVGIILSSILVNNNGVYYKQSAIVNEGLSLNDTISTINKNIMQALAIASSYPEVSPTFTSNTETLILKLSAFNNEEIIKDVYDYIIIYKDSTNQKVLKLQIFPGLGSERVASIFVLTNILQDLVFSYLDKDGNPISPATATSIGVKLTVLSKTGSIDSSRSSSSVTNLRNY